MALKEREKKTVLLGGMGVILVILAWFLFLREGSSWNRWLDLSDKVVQREDDLSKIHRLQRSFIKLQARTEKVKRRMADAGKEAVLSRGLVERLVGNKAPTAELKQMKTSSDPIHGIYLETEVKVELAGLSLEQLINLLYALEYEAGPQVIRELMVDLNRKNNDLLDAEITIVAASPLEQEQGDKKK